MKQTILFSNVVGDICSDKNDCEFNSNLTNVLKSSIKNNSNLVFINAPGFQNDHLYFEKILKCFEKVGIVFEKTIELSDNSKKEEFLNFPKSRVYFLMGGNPLTQLEIIKQYDLQAELKNFDGVVIGFCAGAINLSKYSIITSDDDFAEPMWYQGINRVDISIEPHFKLDDTDFTKNRLKEIEKFCNDLKINIYAVPDESVINVVGKKVEFFGKVYKY